jgi:hypothetical protein
MPEGPANYAGKLTKEEEAHIMTLQRPEDITDYLHQLELNAGLRVEDAANNQVLHEIDRSQMIAPVTIKIAGQTFSGTQEEVDSAMLAHFRSHQTQPPADSAARDSNGRFAKEERRPNPTPRLTEGADRITGNLVANALAAQGISIDDLKEIVAGPVADRTVVTSWAEATEAFKENYFKDTQSAWPGGPEWVEAIGQKIAELGLQDQPSAESLQRAYEAVRAASEQYSAIRDAKTPDEIAEALGMRGRFEARVKAGRSY